MASGLVYVAFWSSSRSCTDEPVAISAANRLGQASNVKSASVKLAKVVRVPVGNAYGKPTVLQGTADANSPAAKASSGTGGGSGGGHGTLSGFPGDEIVLRVGGIDPNAAKTVTFTVHTTTANGGTASMNSQASFTLPR